MERAGVFPTGDSALELFDSLSGVYLGLFSERAPAPVEKPEDYTNSYPVMRALVSGN